MYETMYDNITPTPTAAQIETRDHHVEMAEGVMECAIAFEAEQDRDADEEKMGDDDSMHCESDMESIYGAYEEPGGGQLLDFNPDEWEPVTDSDEEDSGDDKEPRRGQLTDFNPDEWELVVDSGEEDMGDVEGSKDAEPATQPAEQLGQEQQRKQDEADGAKSRRMLNQDTGVANRANYTTPSASRNPTGERGNDEDK
jgi:hypothetical protein